MSAKRFRGAMAGLAILTVLLALAGSALAHPPGAMGGGMGPSMGMGHMGMGYGGMYGGMGGCPGMAGVATTAGQVTEERAKELAKEYADKYLPGFEVDKVLPFTGRNNRTMYSVELKGPNDEVRVLHVNPFGYVRPSGGPWRRGT